MDPKSCTFLNTISLLTQNQKYYSFLKATQSNNAVLTVPSEFWFHHLISEVLKWKIISSFPFHYTSRLFFWLIKKLEIKTLLLLKNIPVKQGFSLSLFYRGNQKLVQSPTKKKKLQETTTCSIWNFWK